jgi:hypothetical protein
LYEQQFVRFRVFRVSVVEQVLISKTMVDQMNAQIAHEFGLAPVVNVAG